MDLLALRDRIRTLRQEVGRSPGMNPMLSAALELSRDLEAGRIDTAELRRLSRQLMDRACLRRGRRLREQTGYADAEAALGDFERLVRESAIDPATGEPDFERFEGRWTRPAAGVVMTGHPTFSLSEELTATVVEAAGDLEPIPEDPALGLPHRPESVITLSSEHHLAQQALGYFRQAYATLATRFFAAAAELFPERWTELRPGFATAASWIGYDLDGRTDIHWTDSVVFRLGEKVAQLGDLESRFGTIRQGLPSEVAADPENAALIREIAGLIRTGRQTAERNRRALATALDEGERSLSALVEAANRISDATEFRLTSLAPVSERVRRLLVTVEDPTSKRSLAVLATLMDIFGLGTSHIHLRINAMQLHNAFRAYVGENWAADLGDRSAIARIAEMIESAEPESVNFGSIMAESATAIRQFVIMAQILKHVDADQPIRFLIAECEEPATLLVALFFTRIFGIEDKVDISPLFETDVALTDGASLIGRVLREPSYRAYVEKRDRLSIQTGFSDAGRFLGQLPATLAVERVQMKLAKLLERMELGHIEVVIFDTHGESMGRGAHPDSLSARLRYLLSDEARRSFAAHRQPVKHETSFQGGDGFLFFGTRDLATMTLSAIVADATWPMPETVEAASDPFYEDRDFSLDFFTRLKAFQLDVYENRGYRTALGAFGTNLLFKTGSRPVRRQHDYATAVDRGNPARIRAIPHNAILQQLGYLCNVVAGFSRAVPHDRSRFVEMVERSGRLRSLVRLAGDAKRLSSLSAMAAYGALFDAGLWAARAYTEQEPELTRPLTLLAETLMEDDRAGRIVGFVNALRLDAMELHELLAAVGVDGGKEPDGERLELDTLHVIRLALLMRVYLMAARVPRFTTRNDFSHEQFLASVISLEVGQALAVVRQAFPPRAGLPTELDKLTEKATYEPQGHGGYSRLQSDIFDPLEEAYELAREIGVGLSHHFGAYG